MEFTSIFCAPRIDGTNVESVGFSTEPVHLWDVMWNPNITLQVILVKIVASISRYGLIAWRIVDKRTVASIKCISWIQNPIERNCTVISVDRDGVMTDEVLLSYLLRTEDRQYKCSACGAQYKTNTPLRCHVESKHYSPGYICPYCGKRFQIFTSYHKHKKAMTCLQPRQYHLKPWWINLP